MHSVSRFVGIAVRAASLGGLRVRPATDELCRVCLQAPATTDGTNEPSWAHKYAGSDITAGHMGVSIAGAGPAGPRRGGRAENFGNYDPFCTALCTARIAAPRSGHKPPETGQNQRS